jgi:tetratricopeptide (TPR) repeat protein
MLERLGQIASYENDFDTAIRLSEEALAIRRDNGQRVNEGKVLVNLGTTCSHAGQFERARDCAQRGIAIAREVGHLGIEAYGELLLGAVEIETDHPAKAREHYQKLVELAKRLGDRFLETLGRGGLAQVELALNNTDAAHRLSLDVLADFAAGGLRREMTQALDDIAHAIASRGDAVTAARLFAAAKRERDSAGTRLAVSEAARLDGRINAARAAAPAEFAAAWAEGEGMTLEEAMDLARRTPLRAAVSQGAQSLSAGGS